MTSPSDFRPPHFEPEELVPPETMASGLTEAEIYKLFDFRILVALETMRKMLGKPITVNNWAKGGPFKYRGYRPPDCPVGAPNSAHKKGMAIDCDIAGMSAEEARAWVRKNIDKPGINLIRRMERKVNWLHIDCMPGASAPFVEFNP